MTRFTPRNTRCVDGRVMRHDPQHDDPELETDIGRCPECDGHGCIRCDACDAPTANLEFICKDCEQNRAEAAWERHCEDFHDGGASGWVTLAEQQAAARRFK